MADVQLEQHICSEEERDISKGTRPLADSKNDLVRASIFDLLIQHFNKTNYPLKVHWPEVVAKWIVRDILNLTSATCL